MQSLLRSRLGLHLSYLIMIICSIKDNDAISTAIAIGTASIIFVIIYIIQDNDENSTATVIGAASFIFDSDYLHY
jgi:hypothetical protein